MDEPTTPAPVIARRIAGLLLVDTRGWLLIQLRRQDAHADPGVWGLVGGGVEPGETPEEGARRELLEETGLTIPGPLTLFWEGIRAISPDSARLLAWHVFCARTTARQDELILGEGEALEFVESERIGSLNLSHTLRYFTETFLASEEYRRLADGAGGE